MKITGYNGVTFADLHVGAGAPDDLLGPDQRPLVQVRPGSNPSQVGLTRDVRAIPVTFLVKPNQPTESTLLALLGALGLDDDTERPLTGTLNSGTDVTMQASVGTFEYRSKNQVIVTFYASDPRWYEATASSATESTPGGGGVQSIDMTVSNNGQATVPVVITFAPTSHDTGQHGLNRRQVTITNDGDTALIRHPYRLDLGDTSDWSWFNSIYGTDDDLRDDEFQVWRDGIEVPRDPINLGGKQSYCWIVIDALGPGETVTYDLTYHGSIGGAGKTFAWYQEPVFDVSWEAGSVSSATSTSVTISGAAYQTNQWADGDVTIVDGTGAGQSLPISSNTSTKITTVGSWTTTPDSTSRYLLTMSRNDRWVYAMRKTERSDRRRGLWATSGRGQSEPDTIRYEAPGSWYLYSYLDNTDVRAQKEATPVVIGSSTDWFTGLDANRTWQAHAPFMKGSPVHDGIAFRAPLPITGWTFDYQLKNPNGLCEAFFGCREAGGAGWTSLLTDTTAHDDLTAVSVASQTPPSAIAPTELVAALLPRDETSIPDTWRKDSGTWSSGGTSTFGDATKTEWVLGQWDGATITIISGTGQGQQSVVTGNSGGDAKLLAVSPSWTTQPDPTSRYQIVNKPLTATLRSGDRCRVDLDDSDLAQSLGDEAANYTIDQSIILNGSGSGHTGAPLQRLRMDGSTRQIFLAAGEALELDAGKRRARVIDADTGALIRPLAGGYVLSETVDAAGAVRLSDWFRLTPGSHHIVTSSLVGGDYTLSWREGYYGG